MITAIIRNKENTLVLDLPHSIYDIYEKLQSIGIMQPPKRIPLTDNEDEDIGVKLFSESDFGQHLLLTLNEKNTIADANMLTLVTVEQKLREAFDALYTELVPPEMQSAIEMEILKETIARQEQIEADKRFGLFHIRENHEDRYYLNEFIRQPYASACRYRLYSQNESSSEPKRFADALLGSVPITVTDYENLAERFEDEPKILSVMDFDLDDGTVSVTDAGGSRAYSLQNVSAAAYQAHRSRQLTAEEKAEVFADYLDGKEIEQTSLVPEM